MSNVSIVVVVLLIVWVSALAAYSHMAMVPLIQSPISHLGGQHSLETQKAPAAAAILDEVHMGLGVKPAVDGFDLK